MAVSDHFNGKIFLNPVPTEMMKPGAIFRILPKYFKKHPGTVPKQTLGPFPFDPSSFNTSNEQNLKVTWLGHSSLLLEVDGKRFLTDPVWYNRVSPFKYLGPKRFFPNPLNIDHLPKIDAVILSHDHYDHLDKKSVLQLAEKQIAIITMLGVGERLINWGVAKELVTELDWWQSTSLAKDFTITAAPARHFSGRWLTDRFKTLWGSFAIKGPIHNVFFGADSGYYTGFTTIREKLGPFDLAFLEIGAYNEEWESIHMGPENAIQATLDLGKPLLFPIHWGTFNLAMHPWKEPVERLMAEAERKNVKLLLAAPGEMINVEADTSYVNTWWQKFQ